MGVDDILLDDLIREHLTRKAPLGRRSAGFPSTEEYHAFVTGEMKGEALERMLAYLREHPEERDFIASARGAVGNLERRDLPRPPARWIRDARRLASKPAASAPKAAVWGLLALGAFALSFAFPRFFIQFLALAVVMGLRWAFEALPRRTQIFVQRSEPAAVTGRDKEK